MKGVNHLRVTEVASGRFQGMLPHFNLGKKAENQLQDSKAKVMASFS